MAENVDNPLLEMLKALRNELRSLRTRFDDDMSDLKARMSSLELAMVSVRRDINHGDEVDARQQVSLDQVARRLERIERRLDLAEADKTS